MDKLLSHPTALKILSLIIGVLLWAVVHFDPDSPAQPASLTETRVIEAVKIQTENLDPINMSIKSMEPSVVRIVVSGSLTALAASQDQYRVSVDLNGLGPGVHDLPLKVKLPPRLQRVEVSPARVKVELVPVETRELDVTIRTEGTPANGYKIGEPIVKPGSRVFVTLPKDIMETVRSVGAVVDVEGVEETVKNKRVKLAVYDRDGNVIEAAGINPSTVEVEVPITKPFKQVPLQIGFDGKLQAGLSIASFLPDVDKVTVYGPQRVLDKMDFFDGLTVNLSAIKQSGRLTLDLKPTGELASVDPQQVHIDVEVTPAGSRMLADVPVTLAGLAEGLQVKFVTPAAGTIDLPLTGAPSMLAKLTTKDVQAVAGLEGLTPGRHTIALDVHLPEFISAGFVSPPTVVVDIVDTTNADVPASGPGDENGGTGAGNEADGGAAGDREPGSSAPSDGAGTGTGTGSADDGDTPSGSGFGSNEPSGSQPADGSP